MDAAQEEGPMGMQGTTIDLKPYDKHSLASAIRSTTFASKMRHLSASYRILLSSNEAVSLPEISESDGPDSALVRLELDMYFLNLGALLLEGAAGSMKRPIGWIARTLFCGEVSLDDDTAAITSI